MNVVMIAIIASTASSLPAAGMYSYPFFLEEASVVKIAYGAPALPTTGIDAGKGLHVNQYFSATGGQCQTVPGQGVIEHDANLDITSFSVVANLGNSEPYRANLHAVWLPTKLVTIIAASLSAVAHLAYLLKLCGKDSWNRGADENQIIRINMNMLKGIIMLTGFLDTVVIYRLSGVSSYETLISLTVFFVFSEMLVYQLGTENILVDGSLVSLFTLIYVWFIVTSNRYPYTHPDLATVEHGVSIYSTMILVLVVLFRGYPFFSRFYMADVRENKPESSETVNDYTKQQTLISFICVLCYKFTYYVLFVLMLTEANNSNVSC